MEKTITPTTIRCFVAGKSGGHILPALAKAREFLNESPNNKVLFIATSNELDKRLLKNVETNIFVYYLPIKPIPGKKIWYYPLFIYTFLTSLSKSMHLLLKKKPDSIVSMGGFISIPVCLAGLLLRIPYHLYELNVIPGKANKLLVRWASTINICFQQTQNYFNTSCTFVPYPLKHSCPPKEQRKQSKHKTLLIIGGSQGSVFLNTIIKKWIEQRTKVSKLFIMHQTGVHEAQHYKEFYKTKSVQADVFAFDSCITHRYQQADLIICRSGAGTLFELAQLQKPCITIPLPTTITDHQRHNAQAMSQQYPFIYTLSQEEVTNSQEVFFKLLEDKLMAYQQ